MRVCTLALTPLFACAPLLTAGAQDESDQVGAIVAATIFVRDSVIGRLGPFVIDEAYWKRGPGISESAARGVAEAVGATRGGSGDVIGCDEPRPMTRQRCTSANDAIVLTFARPEIHGGVATVGMAYMHVNQYNHRPELSEWSIEVRRAGNGPWRVTAARETGVS